MRKRVAGKNPAIWPRRNLRICVAPVVVSSVFGFYFLPVSSWRYSHVPVIISSSNSVNVMYSSTQSQRFSDSFLFHWYRGTRRHIIKSVKLMIMVLHGAHFPSSFSSYHIDNALYSRTSSTNGHLSTAALFWQTVHTFTPVSTSL